MPGLSVRWYVSFVDPGGQRSGCHLQDKQELLHKIRIDSGVHQARIRNTHECKHYAAALRRLVSGLRILYAWTKTQLW